MQKIIDLFRKSKKEDIAQLQEPTESVPVPGENLNQLNTSNLQPPVPPVNKHKRLYYLLSILTVITIFSGPFLWNKRDLVILGYYILRYNLKQFNPFRNEPSYYVFTQTNEGQAQLEYRSTYWGFSVNYPQHFRAIQILDGVILANYYWSNDNPNYKLANRDIRIEISTVDRVFEQPWYNSREEVEEYKTFSINSENVAFYKVTDSSPGGGADRFIAAEIIHDGFTYRFNIERGDLASEEDIKKITESLKFIPKDEYLFPQKPASAGMKRFSNTRWGFAFDYPENWYFEKFDPLYTTVDTGKENRHVLIQMLPRYLSLSGDFLEDVKRDASRQCAADGSGSSISCPEEDIKINTAINARGSKQFILKRKRVFAYYNSEEKTVYDETVVAYPLSIQEYYAIVFSPLGLSLGEENDAVLELGNNFQYLERTSLEIIDGSLYRILASGEKKLLIDKEETGKIWDFSEVRSPDNSKTLFLIVGGISPYFLYYVPSDHDSPKQIGWTEEIEWSNNSRYFAYLSKPADAGPLIWIYVYDTQTGQGTEISKGHKIPELSYSYLGFSNLRWLDDDSGVKVHYDAYAGEMPHGEKVDEGETVINIVD